MPRYKPSSRQPLLLPVDLDEQLMPGSFAFALDHLVDNELNLSALDARFCNDEVTTRGSCSNSCCWAIRKA